MEVAEGPPIDEDVHLLTQLSPVHLLDGGAEAGLPWHSRLVDSLVDVCLGLFKLKDEGHGEDGLEQGPVSPIATAEFGDNCGLEGRLGQLFEGLSESLSLLGVKIDVDDVELDVVLFRDRSIEVPGLLIVDLLLDFVDRLGLLIESGGAMMMGFLLDIDHQELSLSGKASSWWKRLLCSFKVLNLFLKVLDLLVFLLEDHVVHQQRPFVFLAGVDEALSQGLLLQLCGAVSGRCHLLRSFFELGLQLGDLIEELFVALELLFLLLRWLVRRERLIQSCQPLVLLLDLCNGGLLLSDLVEASVPLSHHHVPPPMGYTKICFGFGEEACEPHLRHLCTLELLSDVGGLLHQSIILVIEPVDVILGAGFPSLHQPLPVLVHGLLERLLPQALLVALDDEGPHHLPLDFLRCLWISIIDDVELCLRVDLLPLV